MGKYEQAMEEIVKERFEGGKFIIREHGEEGFEYEIGCADCPMRAYFSEGVHYCRYDAEFFIRKVNGGSNSGGKCFEFYSLEQFWDDFSSEFAIDPETGEVFQI